MPVSERTQKIVEVALADRRAAAELAAAGEISDPAAAIAAITVTPTAGALPVANGAVTIADTATPTVVELLEYCTELKAKFDALNLACKNAGITL